MKETRYYILDVEFCPDNVNSTKLRNWKLYEQRHNKLTSDAEEFISFCEEKGKVLSEDEFVFQLNNIVLNIDNCFIYNTNNY